MSLEHFKLFHLCTMEKAEVKYFLMLTTVNNQVQRWMQKQGL